MDDGRGEVIAEGEFNKCPIVTQYTVAPLQASVPNGQIALTAQGSDEDDDDVLTFAWTASAGTVSPANSADATYTCTVDGSNTLTLTVSDGQCDKTADVVVACIALACGNGELDAGEVCDDGNRIDGDGCAANCASNETCGNGVRDVSVGETCDDGNTVGGDACPADCTLPICGDGQTEEGGGIVETCDDNNTVSGDGCPSDCSLVCGDGVPEEGECEPPNTPTCSATCVPIGPAECGNGEVEPPSETCEPPSQANCGTDCSGISTDACLACENGNDCAPLVNGCDFYEGQVAQAGPAAGVSMEQLCYEAIQCQRESGCGSVGGAIDCYCGSATGAACLSGGANGPCKTVVERSLESIDPPTVAGRFGNTAFAGGAALLRTQCDFALCNPVCFEGRP
jgi:cysteine-rich repeat protein